MEKQLKLFTNVTKPFVLFLLLFALGVGEMWGGDVHTKSGSNIFYDDSNAGWGKTYDYLYYATGFNGDNDATLMRLNKIDNTKLYVAAASEWNNADYCCIFAASASWGTNGGSYDNMKTKGGTISGTISNWTFTSGYNWLITPSGSAKYTSISAAEKGVIANRIGQYNQTVNVVVNGNSSPSTSPAAISITSHYWTAWNAVSSAGSSTAITKGGPTITDAYNNAAYTAETSVEVTSIQDGYYFVGWYDDATGGSLVSDANPYTYYPREANTLYARFESKHTVNIYASMHGGAVGCTTTPSNGTAINNVGYYTSADISATAGNGCFFDQWSTTGGVSVGGTKTNPTTVTTAGSNGTVTAHFYTKWAIMGGHTDSHTGESDDLGDWVDSYNDLVYTASNSFVGTITLPASTTLKFKVWDRETNTYWGCNTTISSSVNDYVFYSSGDNDKNCTLTTGAAGVYTFAWHAGDHKLTLLYPGDKDDATLQKNSYFYFDARNLGTEGDGWRKDDFTARFWFKNIATQADISSADCAKASALEDWVYYVTVPNNDYVGRVQLNRMEGESVTCAANVSFAYKRDNASQNCLKEETGHEGYCNSWDPTWTTYCPPMSSASIQNVGTTVTYGSGAGTSENPYIVATGSSIYTLASSTSALNDGNMAAYYQFKKEGSNDGEESTTNTHTFTASSTNETKEAMTVVARNGFNSAYGTASPTSSAIYYEARTPYTMSYTKGSPSESISGSLASAIKVYNVAYPLPGGAI